MDAPWWAVLAAAVFGGSVGPFITFLAHRKSVDADVLDKQASAAGRLTDSALKLLDEIEELWQGRVEFWRDKFEACSVDKNLMAQALEECRLELGRIHKDMQ